jgi:hypothetical protein
MVLLSAVCTVLYKGPVVSLLLETLISGNHDDDTLYTGSTSKKRFREAYKFKTWIHHV